MSAAEKLRDAGFIPAAEAARRCGIDASTIHRWADSGEVIVQRVGHRLFVSAAAMVEKVGAVAAADLRCEVCGSPTARRCPSTGRPCVPVDETNAA
jgi:hypothetical protein